MDKWSLIFPDRQDDIFYVDDGICPKRGASYNYNKPFPGWEPGAQWPGYIAFRDLLQLINPPDGVSYSVIILRTQRQRSRRSSMCHSRVLLRGRAAAGTASSSTSCPAGSCSRPGPSEGKQDTYMPSTARVHEESLACYWICAAPLKILSVS
jgi:hypothetical protein